MGETMGDVGMTGLASLSVPLPVSPGRAYAPTPVLQYSSGAGNGAFAAGWNVVLLTIRRRTSHGVPPYNSDDIFLAPDGEALVPETGPDGKVITAQVSSYASVTLDQAYTVTRYFPCIEGTYSRIERWSPSDATAEFWLIHGADGQLHCLGKSAQARIADPSEPVNRIGAWLLEESVNPAGEHICYVYEAENTENVDMNGQEASRVQTANRYLTHVQYGNVKGYAPLYAWHKYLSADAPQWLFTLLFDYAERSLDPLVAPSRLRQHAWLCREDSFSDYAFGFELRTHRLCHQVLMFNHFPTELGQQATLVSRLLLGYRQSPQLSRLVSAQMLAYESDGRLQSLPPLDLSYTTFSTDFCAQGYEALPSFAGLNDGSQYQIVDLYGEGLPGILYQVDNDWRYQAPMRGSDGPNAVTYSPWQPLPELPALLPGWGARQALMDLTGDGRLNWVTAQPALAGYFTLNPDRRWSTFVPCQAFPTEFLQPRAQLADIVGAGLMDLALIGPTSVRFYANNRQHGYAAGQDVAHTSNDRLPIGGGDPASLVVFSDVLGSGQQHLVQIRYNQLTCWPNLGRGNFGVPVVLATLPFDPKTFNPERVFLADIDGSGAADLIYAESERFLIFMNQSGNGFDRVPYVLPMPDGVRYDRLDQVSFADIDGSGTACLVLTLSHVPPRHWCYRFARTKPYLLERFNNNMGVDVTLTYRSSAQEWLDEKQASPDSVCELPFAIQLVSSITTLDEVTANTLSQQYMYRRGVYAGLDREFRGFGFVQLRDTQHVAVATSLDVEPAPPMVTRVWYATGMENEVLRPGMPPYHDPDMFSLGPPRLTKYNSVTGRDELLVTMDESTRYQLYRAMKGGVMRQEVYGEDGRESNAVPYRVECGRFQIRLVQPTASGEPTCVCLPTQLELLQVHYECIDDDPLVQQQVVLQVNEFGMATWSVGVSYARRPQPLKNPYPASVSDDLWAATYDEAQVPLRLAELRASVYNLTAQDGWRLGLPWQQRQDALAYANDYGCYPLTSGGLSYEALSAPDGLLGGSRPRELGGQTVTYYFDVSGRQELPSGTLPPLVALVHHVEVAELDARSLVAYANVPAEDLDNHLIAAGYLQRSTVLRHTCEPDASVWVIPSGYTAYVDGQGTWLPFDRPRATQASPIVAPRLLTWDAHTCVVTSVTDGVGNRTAADYDYRFLIPSRVIDANGNTNEVLYDALGRVIASSAYGIQLDESGKAVPTGFAPLSDFNPQAAALNSIEAALADPAAAVQGASAVYLYDPYCWMGQPVTTQTSVFSATTATGEFAPALQEGFLLDAYGRLRSVARSQVKTRNLPNYVLEALDAWIAGNVRKPVEVAALLADQYPTSPTVPQIQIRLSYADGLGRPLQSKQKCPPGVAHVVLPDGRLEKDGNRPVERDTGSMPRWAVSGRVEYDNKGQVIRVYQPYFIDRPVYVDDAQAREWGYADTHYYDAVGREIAVVTALKHLSRIAWYSWFSVAEDPNDTLGECEAFAQDNLCPPCGRN
ncbi:insecticidal toxin complex [Burkholderia stabilis]|uniref:Insecticidal toxin complex n=1 Tax=Burkholderia stabilis TaxID=95485 RepID=A0A4Q2A5L9_9BURK|nr:SpvB/TcaC N-terminal domain-containing protein [Burkholderia stabilis]RXV64368.1 insecticidal toxin complex [Burkholderia stabilis]